MLRRSCLSIKGKLCLAALSAHPAQILSAGVLNSTATSNRNFADAANTAKPATSTPPDDPHHRPADFHRFADIYLGGIWNKLESELRQQEGETFDYDVSMSRGCLLLHLPDGSYVHVCKDPTKESLNVRSTVHESLGSENSSHNDIDFELSPQGVGFEKDGLALHSYLEDGFAKHLKVQMDLKPDNVQEDKTYGPDPT